MSKMISPNTINVFENMDLEPLRNKNILITGSSGLIGINILSLLQNLKKQLNIKIYCWSLSPISGYFNEIFDGCTVINSDLSDNNTKIPSDLIGSFDFIFHCAGYGQPQKFTENKISTININTQSIILLFSLLKSNGSFLYCSSSEIYSGLDIEKISEKDIGTTSPDHPRACYIESKRCGEAICNIFADTNPEQNIKIARISTVYGPGAKLNDSRVLNSLIQKAINNKRIEMLDSGSSTRTFCYTDDAIEMLLTILLHGKQRTYNITGVDILTIKEVASVIAKITSSELIIPINDNSLIGNPKTVIPTIDRYISEFGNKSFMPFESGIENTVAWYKNLLSSNN